MLWTPKCLLMNSEAKNPDRIKIVVYAKDLAKPPVMTALAEQLTAQKDRVDSEILSASAGILKSVEETSLTVLILSMHSKEDLVEVLNVLSQLESRIQSGLLRAVVINGLNHPKVVSLLKSKGVNDIVDFNVTIKALNHKIKNSFLLVSQTLQRLENQNIKAATLLAESAPAPNAKPQRENATEVIWLDIIEHPSDFWWIPSARNLRFVMGRWLVDLLGPGPAAGTWEETTHVREEEKGWEWKARVPTDLTFQPRAGRWIFFGRQPEFVWQKNLWAFVSKFPYLAFYPEGESEPEYVRLESPVAGKVKVRKNSETTQKFLANIQDSLEASLRLSKAEVSDEIPGTFESTPTEAPEDTWNNHESSVGVNFRAKDIRIAQKKAKKKRDSLTPDLILGGKLGMKNVSQIGVVSGVDSFEKPFVRVTLSLRNGQAVAMKDPLRVIQMTKEHAIFESPRNWIEVADKFILKVEFHLGNVERNFEVEWSSQTTQPVDGGGCLAQGKFTGGALAELASVVTIIEQRQIELRDFFIAARGA